MSVQDPDVVDFIGMSEDGNRIVLGISDHLIWDDEHFPTLEKKINAYLAFVRGRQLLETRPDAEGKDVEINIVCKHEPNTKAKSLLAAATEDLGKDGIMLSYDVVD